MVAELAIVEDPSPPVPLPGVMQIPSLGIRFAFGAQAYFREAPIPITCDYVMRTLWKQNRVEFARRGFSLKNHNGQWFLQQWLLTRGNGGCKIYTLTPIGQEILNGLVQPELEAPIPEDEPLDCPPLPDGLEGKLLDYQVQPARQIFRALARGDEEWRYPGAWDCSDLGTGKTYQSLAAAIATGLEVAVVCPMSVIGASPSVLWGGRGSGWKGAFAHFGQHPRMICNYESLRTGRRDWVKLIVEEVRGRRMKRFQWQLDPRHTVLIFDEAHNVKTVGTLNQGLAMAAIRQRFPVIFVSGTLATDPTHMRATGRVVGLHGGMEDFMRFLGEFGCRGKGNSKDIGSVKFCGGSRGRKHLARISRLVFPNRGARVRIEDLGDRFPETQVMAEAYETGEGKGIQAAFEEAEATIRNLMAQGMKESAAMMLKQKAYMKAWQESERLKIGAIVEMAHDEIEEGRSVAIFTNFIETREELMKRLRTSCSIHGQQLVEDRNRCIASFQADRDRVIVCNIMAGGVGVSLHDENGIHPRTAIILPSNNVVAMLQALGRVHRAGGKSRSRQIVFFAGGTLEEDICNNVRAKMGNLSALNDGDLTPRPKF